jgi:hypothetical protein
MRVTGEAWQRWKRFARRATEFQSNVVLLVLYFVFFVPLGLLRFLIARPGGVPDPSWRPRQPPDRSLDAARRQF